MPEARYNLSQITDADINSIAREIMHRAFNIQYTYEACLKDSVSETDKSLFRQDRRLYGPKLQALQLDTAATTNDSEWNQAVVELLTTEARSITFNDASPLSVTTVDWSSLFASRIDRIISDARNLKTKGVFYTTDIKNKKAHRAMLVTKFNRRQRIAAKMIAMCKAFGDNDGLHFWSYVLQVLDHLTYLGMSDEETAIDEDSTEPLKYVFILHFRHPDFRPLFEYVDNTPYMYPECFPQSGPRRLKRVDTQHVVTRSAPSKLPPSFISNNRVHDDGDGETTFPGPSRFLPFVVQHVQRE
ncbi:hypothetical protein C8R42DRAFT_692186 [Lentinula raphanica]|nr:hypothetical protein C8R42DRAFT_692186 [Lentinula raphanica]